MDYEKKYNHALEVVRELQKDWASTQNRAAREIELAFPELCESEDERIRKWLIEYFGSIKETVWIHRDITCGQILAWLEKQKENPKNADSIPEDCVSLAKCEDRDSKYGVFPEDVIVVARACEKLEAHGYPELAHALKNVNLYTKPVDYDHEMWKNCEANFEGGKKEVIDHPEKYGLQKEQKVPDCCLKCNEYEIGYKAGYEHGCTAGYNKAMKEMEQKDQKPVDDSDFKTALAEYMTKNCKKGEGPHGYSYSISSESILQMAKEELIKRGELKEQKPAWSEVDSVTLDCAEEVVERAGLPSLAASLKSLRPQPKQEWSEEDEAHLGWIIECFYSWKYQVPEFADQYQSAIDFLKSLRPSWKPSEGQMDALAYASQVLGSDLSPRAAKASEELEHLREQLNKL